jgi:membrane protein required for beta-lactamase induction
MRDFTLGDIVVMLRAIVGVLHHFMVMLMGLVVAVMLMGGRHFGSVGDRAVMHRTA